MNRRRFFRYLSGLVGLMLTAQLISGCTARLAPSQLPQIVVTTNILGDVVQELVGSQAEVTILMKPNADPHSFEISAQEAAGLLDADLIVANGLGLEEGLEQHLNLAQAQGSKVFNAGEQIDVLDYHSQQESSSIDPHFWTDPQRMIDVLDALVQELGQLSQIDAQLLAASANEYRGELQKVDADLEAQFLSIPEASRKL